LGDTPGHPRPGVRFAPSLARLFSRIHSREAPPSVGDRCRLDDAGREKSLEGLLARIELRPVPGDRITYNRGSDMAAPPAGGFGIRRSPNPVELNQRRPF